MHLRALPLLFVLMALVGSGCGTTAPSTSVSYKANQNRTTYQTGTIRVGRLQGLGYGSNTSILMSVQARCPGRNCTPKEARLSFLLQGSSSDVALSNRSISLTADGTEYARRSAVNWRSREDIRMSQGRIASVTLSLSALSNIANASSLSGQLGNNTLNLDGGVQTRLQEMIRTMRNPEAPAPADAS